jgi:lipid-binding SYLF domain-containing protein
MEDPDMLQLPFLTRPGFRQALLATCSVLLLAGTAAAASSPDKYTATIRIFKKAGGSATFFPKSYAYAVFPTVGEGALVVGGAMGKGRVYVHGKLVGDTTMTQISVGFQAGGKAFSQIIFFENKQSLDQFKTGTFQFAAGASAVAATASVSASAGTTGAAAGASLHKNDADTTGHFENGMAVFTIAKGGLMYTANIAGQKFSYEPRGG